MHWSELFTAQHLPWVILWCGLFALIVGLIVLMRTHWGQSNPLRKCAVLSLLVHLILAAYATTVEIVSGAAIGPPGSGSGRGMNVSIVGTAEGNATFAGEGDGTATQPWEAPPLAALNVPAVETPGKIDLTPNWSPERLSTDVADLLKTPEAPKIPVAPAPPKLEMLAGDPHERKPFGEPSAPIDEVAPKVADKTPELQPAVKPLERANPSDQVTGAGNKNTTGLNEQTEMRPLLPLDNALPLAKANVDGGGPTPVASAGEPAGDPFGRGGDAVAIKRSTWANTKPLPATSTGTDNQVPTPFANRVAPDHGGAVRRGGGSPQAEAAVKAAHAWLDSAQSTDGRWEAKRFGAGVERKVLGHDRNGAGARADTGVTGLALLAYLGAGHTHLAGEHPQTVRKGLEFLINAQARDGNLAGDAEMFAHMYCHGMATLALSEAYAMTKDARLEPYLKRAIQYTLAAQNVSTGGWRYKPGDEGDTSQLGWQLMSLKSAELAGINLPKQSRDGIVRFLKNVTFGKNNGLASYRPGERVSRTMTAEALVCRQFLGMDRNNPASDEAGDFLLEELPNAKQMNLYYWYYASLGMYQLQGRHWERWNDALQRALFATQETDGPNLGSWAPDGDVWGGYGGRVYSTAMAALCLEVYYRYLPLYGEK